MNIKFPTYLLLLFIFASCGEKTQQGSTDQWKQEIIETEKRFAQMAAEEGIREAFLSFAAEDAVLMRNDSLVVGIKAITEYLNTQAPADSNMSLEWKPDFTDVSSSGDLGYTYGKFIFSMADSTGNRVERTGVFHTVWKRQEDGTWRFVWD
ncbi:Ketosteroid isomerase homolog [Muriicola jejuensis]|uniref:DUF4440 domain-containing protein n=1 Tax=Muriicola jejuensis TaxID=504488 RepID=A0A6P0UB26_9FLAO|nr:nuclear transport factor 2 family protein [Muriicola jejuensis]NER10394.1 DUF4440 domain-containing protein [Muriicola jejuensis]SMP00952.1 Ketosteroid isomerase homolog [Muriicola jejuensis]